MLRGDAQVADVAESVLAVAGGEEGVEFGLVGILRGRALLWWLRGDALLEGEFGGRVVLNGVGALGEVVRGLLFRQCGESGRFAVAVRDLWWALSGEGVVASRRLRLDGRRAVAARCPGIVGTGLCGWLLWLLRLRLRLLLLLAGTVHYLRPGVVGVLRLDELLLRLLHLFISRLLGLIVAKPASIAVLLLQARWLGVGIVQKARLLWLLLLSDRIAEPVDLRLLLVSLVEAGRLRDLFRGRIVKEQVGLILIFQLALPQLLLFFAELDGFGEIVIVVGIAATTTTAPRSTSRVCLGFVLGRFESKAVLEIVLCVVAGGFAARFATARRGGITPFAVRRAPSEFLETCHARLPRAPVCSLSA